MILLVGVSLGLFARTLLGPPEADFPKRKPRTSPSVESLEEDQDQPDDEEPQDMDRFV